MNFKHWQWETHALREKEKRPTVKEIASVLFENDTQAYRFALVLTLVKRKGSLMLRDMPADLPKATWHRYLETGYELGFFDKKGDAYFKSNRFTNPIRNFGEYYEKWLKDERDEGDVAPLFPNALKGRHSGKKKEEDGGV
ncbi:hypothetical protein HY995_01390 [Candidatus Micrarchaeota archaeon]|nr:hypothetical protein [Candidatus Micrarchaeota archaeon]MBI5176721.1 hypothetical protein [Candidatus Micrarchaeota archaeon]